MEVYFYMLHLSEYQFFNISQLLPSKNSKNEFKKYKHEVALKLNYAA
jgi:hypothetical protein